MTGPRIGTRVRHRLSGEIGVMLRTKSGDMHIGRPTGAMTCFLGYSDEKPHWSFWLMIAGMVAFVLYRAITT